MCSRASDLHGTGAAEVNTGAWQQGTPRRALPSPCPAPLSALSEARLEGVGAGLEGCVVADGVWGQRGAAVPHGSQQVQGLGCGGLG